MDNKNLVILVLVAGVVYLSIRHHKDTGSYV